MRIAFYAPLKGPDHPVPSGDRQMARMLISALQAGGHAVEIASTLRSLLLTPDPLRQAEIEAAAAMEVVAIEERWQSGGEAVPALWLTYHPFYKAPDLLGPLLARRFAIPYATAEASNAPKRAAGPWSTWHASIERALRIAAVHFCFTDQDRDGLERLLGPDATILSLPPFIDGSVFPVGTRRQPGQRIELVTVAMMRSGDKMRSFAFLAAALRQVPETVSWHLSIVGDGPARREVEAAFSPLGQTRVSFLGEVATPAVGAVLAGGDLYVWPGFNEAYGLSYLEAGATGLPTLAMRCGGIESVIIDGRTGILVPEGDLQAYVKALVGLMRDDTARHRLGGAAAAFVRSERTVGHAAAILDAGLDAALERVNR